MLLNPYRFGSLPPPFTDPHWANVSCLLHMDGADASTTITDQKGGSWVASGGAQIKTDISKFGGAALLLDGAGDVVTRANSAAFTFGTGDFTIETWFYCATDFNGSTTQKPFAAKWGGTNAKSWIFDYSLGNLRGIIADTSNIARTTQVATTFTAGNWYHIAWTRAAGVSYLFVNGTLLHSEAFTHSMKVTATPILIGYKSDGTGSEYLNGRLDEFRITKDVGRYTASFTAPTAAFPDS